MRDFHESVYTWPKAFAGMFASWGFGIVALLSSLPWYTIFSFIVGLVPPILKVVYDTDKKKLKSDADLKAMEIAELKQNQKVLESNLAIAIRTMESAANVFISAQENNDKEIQRQNQGVSENSGKRACAEPEELPDAPAGTEERP